MDSPLISVILPIYNCEKFIKPCLDSLLAQYEKNFEIIIIDDASTDNSLNIVQEYNDKRIQIVKKSINSGYVISLNLGIKIAKGMFIARMDIDDISLPRRFYRQIQILNSNPKAAGIGTLISIIDEDEKIIGNWKNDMSAITWPQIKAYLPKGNCFCHSSMMIRKDIFNHYCYDNSQYGSEDWDLWLQICSDGFQILKVNEILHYYRVSPNSVSNVIDKRIGVKLKAVRTQYRYLLKRLIGGKFNIFDFNVLFYLIVNFFIVLKGEVRKLLSHKFK